MVRSQSPPWENKTDIPRECAILYPWWCNTFLTTGINTRWIHQGNVKHWNGPGTAFDVLCCSVAMPFTLSRGISARSMVSLSYVKDLFCCPAALYILLVEGVWRIVLNIPIPYIQLSLWCGMWFAPRPGQMNLISPSLQGRHMEKVTTQTNLAINNIGTKKKLKKKIKRKHKKLFFLWI